MMMSGGESNLMGRGTEVLVNTRSIGGSFSGVQRYAAEILRRLDGKVREVAPRRSLHGVRGHLWEQVALPAKVKSNLLWSPANTGPLSIARQVVTVHDVAPLERAEWFTPRFAAWYRWLIPRLVHRAYRVIAVSKFTKERIADLTGVDESHIVVIPNGVDERFCPRPIDEREIAQRQLGIPSPHYVLCLSTLEPRKNIAGLIQAWNACVHEIPDDIFLVVSGASGKRHIFEQLNLEHIPARVRVTGFVEDSQLPALYSGALALVNLSVYEGFGLPVLEAMAAGTVPICSNLTAFPELVGNAGILVDPYDVDSIASAIRKVIENTALRDELRALATSRSRNFTWDQAAQDTWQVLVDAQSMSHASDCALDRRPRAEIG